MPTCRGCSNDFPRGELSKRGLCPTCSSQRIQFSISSMQNKSGPLYNHWRARFERGMIRLWGNKGSDNTS